MLSRQIRPLALVDPAPVVSQHIWVSAVAPSMVFEKLDHFFKASFPCLGQSADVILIDLRQLSGAIDAAEPLPSTTTCAEAIVQAFSTLTGMSWSDANRTASNVTVTIDAAVSFDSLGVVSTP